MHSLRRLLRGLVMLPPNDAALCGHLAQTLSRAESTGCTGRFDSPPPLCVRKASGLNFTVNCESTCERDPMNRLELEATETGMFTAIS
jgi:hypothetical protein